MLGGQEDTLAREVGLRMAERLDYVRLQPARVLDAGTGAGHGLDDLVKRYPHAQLVGVDFALAQLAQIRARRSVLVRARELMLARRYPRLACADFAQLPFAPQSFQLVWSNLALPWAPNPVDVFREFQRVLDVNGLVMFSTYGPDTLKEVRQVFGGIDALPHTLSFMDMHDLGDMLVAAGFSDPVMDMEVITLTYSDLNSLVSDLRTTGQVNVVSKRRRGLLGRRAYQSLLGAYEGLRSQGRLPATIEIIYGHAWQGKPRLAPDGRSIVQMDLGRKIARRR
jgi:malonyl-CoA O-methyltransferase